MAKQNCREEITELIKRRYQSCLYEKGTEVLANRFGRNSGNGNVVWMDVVKLR